MRARGSFRMVLYGKYRQFFMRHAFKGIIIQIYMRQLYLVFIQGIHIHAKTVVLRGDFYFAGLKILHRMIRASVPEF